jgi:hypothetical protein
VLAKGIAASLTQGGQFPTGDRFFRWKQNSQCALWLVYVDHGVARTGQYIHVTVSVNAASTDVVQRTGGKPENPVLKLIVLRAMFACQCARKYVEKSFPER